MPTRRCLHRALSASFLACLFVGGFASAQTCQFEAIGPVTDFPQNASISYDGKRVAFTSERDLTGKNPDEIWQAFTFTPGSGVDQLTSFTESGAVAAAVSYDGSVVYLVTDLDPTGGTPDGNRQLYSIELETGTVTQLTSGPGLLFISRRTAEDGRVLLTRSGAWVIFDPSDGTSTPLLAFDAGLRDAAPDFSLFALVSAEYFVPGSNADGSHEIFLFTPDTGYEQITDVSAATNSLSFDDVEVSADGDRIVFQSNLNLTGDNPELLREAFLWRRGGGLTQLTASTSLTAIDSLAANDDVTDPILLDHDFLPAPGAFDYGLYFLDSETREETLLFGDHSVFPFLSGDGTSFVFSSAEPLFFDPDLRSYFFWARCADDLTLAEIPTLDSISLALLGLALGLAALTVIARRRAARRSANHLRAIAEHRI
ncbi:MAG: hypothetical protein AAGC60_12110 [Acidobacteriota bacterium]